MEVLIDKWETMRALQAINPVAKLMDGDLVIKISEVENVLEHIPSVQPHKTGQWLPDTNNYYEERFVCSVCRRSYKVDTCMGKPIWDFCPCGADMRGERDE